MIMNDRDRATRRNDSRAGFTLVELMVAAAIVGILAGLAIPNLGTMILRARAAEVAGDLEVVRVAALQYNADHHTWPSETALGNVPAGLEEYLPENFSFQGNGYQIDYENWDLPSGFPGDPNARRLVGVSVNTDEETLSNAIVEFIPGAVVFSVGTTHTILIDRS